LAFAVAKIDISSSEIGNAKGGDDRFVCDVLQTRQLEIDLDLRLDAGGNQKQSGEQRRQFHRAVE
jgi:hypothetical protein